MDTFIGTICVFGFNFAPYQWQYCNGQTLPISSYTALFSLIGTYYGGNGTSTFQLPNLQGRVAIDQGQLTGGSLYSIGQEGGTTSATLLLQNLPLHTHPLTVALNCNNNSGGAVSSNPQGNSPAFNSHNPYNSAASTPAAYMPSFNVVLGNTGGTTPINITDPSLVMNYCIALYGIFPARN